MNDAGKAEAYADTTDENRDAVMEAIDGCPVSAIREEESDTGKASKYQCGPCGYVYDPEVGDPDSGIAPGTAFEDLPDDWCCPICGVSKDMFEKIQ